MRSSRENERVYGNWASPPSSPDEIRSAYDHLIKEGRLMGKMLNEFIFGDPGEFRALPNPVLLGTDHLRLEEKSLHVSPHYS